MKVGNHASLISLASNAPLDGDYAKQFRQAATGAVDRAIDVFFQSDREKTQGMQAYNDLTEVQLALKAARSRVAKETSANNAALKSESQRAKLPPTESVDIGFSSYGRGPVDQGKRTTTYHSTSCSPAKPADLSRLEKLDKHLSALLPLYASVALAPGPLSASLKTQVQEMLQFQSQASSSSSGYSREDSFSLFPLRAGARLESHQSSAHQESEGSATSTPIDERVVPSLHQLRETLGGLGLTAPQDGAIYADGKVVEMGLVSYSTEPGWFRDGEMRTAYRPIYDGYAHKQIDTKPSTPAHLDVGSTIQDYPAGSLCEAAALEPLSAELADKLKTRGMEAVQSAISVMFSPDREVQDGRQAYDQLTDLGRALKTVANRQKEPVDSPLRAFANQVDQLAPLYACVAMVPGELSSSVKNFTKDVASYRSQSSGGSVERSQAETISLLPPGYSNQRGYSASGFSQSSQASYQTTTTDERLMQQLHGVQTDLFGLEARGNRLSLS
ncbi:MAG: hypothetical protein KC910_19590 [Candidatus Eremiobacteraeota bacterium]|nr:hypothetical protein [Candidatus Eremiobacteraeota bacterium]